MKHERTLNTLNYLAAALMVVSVGTVLWQLKMWFTLALILVDLGVMYFLGFNRGSTAGWNRVLNLMRAWEKEQREGENGQESDS